MKFAEYLTSAVVTVIFLTLFARGAGRLLGLRLGTVRAFLAGVVGIAALALFSLFMQRPDQGGFLTSVQFGSTLVVAMAFLAVTDTLLPEGARHLMAWLPSGIRARAARARRYSQVSSIAVRHGLRPYLRGGSASPGGSHREGRLALALRLAFEEAGAAFVKLGQVLATRDDLLPAVFVEELSRLHHRVSPEPWPAVEAALSRRFGRPVGDVFAQFDPEPIAAASVAQVHAARLWSGGEVVVKVRRPGITVMLERDLEIICRLAVMLEGRTRWARNLRLGRLAEAFAASVHEELDFRVEARNIAVVRGAWARRGAEPSGGRNAVRLPAVHEDLSAADVLVLEKLPGVPVGDAGKQLDALGADRHGLARLLLSCSLRQVLLDGTFHADPHPGNVLVLEDGSLGLVDFGSVGRIDGRLRAGLRDVLFALRQRDTGLLCDGLLDMVSPSEEVDRRRLERDLGRFTARYLVPGDPRGIQAFTMLLRLVTEHGLEVPPELTAVLRTFGTLDGTLTRLCPGFDMMAESPSLAGEWLSPSAATASDGSLGFELFDALSMLRRMPRRVDRIAGAIEEGRLTVGVRLFADARDRRYVRSLVHDVLLTAVAATTGLLGAILLAIRHDPMVTHDLGLFEIFGYNLLVVSAILLVRVLFDISRPGR